LINCIIVRVRFLESEKLNFKEIVQRRRPISIYQTKHEFSGVLIQGIKSSALREELKDIMDTESPDDSNGV